MKKRNRTLRRLAMVAAATAGTLAVNAPGASAGVPTVMTDDGAYVRLVGNPADGTAKFQYGWNGGSEASDAVGYWVGLYDVTNSHYEWSFDTGEMELPDALFKNAKPTAELPNGDYKVVFFVRGAYEPEPATNISEIELPFTVSNSMM